MRIEKRLELLQQVSIDLSCRSIFYESKLQNRDLDILKHLKEVCLTGTRFLSDVYMISIHYICIEPNLHSVGNSCLCILMMNI